MVWGSAALRVALLYVLFLLLDIVVGSPGCCVCEGMLFGGAILEYVFVVFAFVSLVTMFSMRESWMPVRVYFRWYRENVWARDWECLSVGKVPL